LKPKGEEGREVRSPEAPVAGKPRGRRNYVTEKKQRKKMGGERKRAKMNPILTNGLKMVAAGLRDHLPEEKPKKKKKGLSGRLDFRNLIKVSEEKKKLGLGERPREVHGEMRGNLGGEKRRADVRKKGRHPKGGSLHAKQKRKKLARPRNGSNSRARLRPISPGRVKGKTRGREEGQGTSEKRGKPDERGGVVHWP